MKDYITHDAVQKIPESHISHSEQITPNVCWVLHTSVKHFKRCNQVDLFTFSKQNI